MKVLYFFKKYRVLFNVLVLIIVCIAGWIGMNRYIENLEEEFYQQAIAMMEEKNYSEALTLLDEIVDEDSSMGVSGLVKLCEAHISYEGGSLQAAYYSIKSVTKLTVESEIILADFTAFRGKVIDEFMSSLKKTTTVVTKATIRASSSSSSSSSSKSSSSSSKSSSSSSKSSSSSSKSSSSSSSSSDPYNASSYSHPDDFYYDYYDDFYDYEDAEKYWKSHQ